MLNSKDRIVQVLKDHFKALGIDIELTSKKLIIRDTLFNVNIVIHSIIALLVIRLSVSLGAAYLSPIIFLYAIILYVIFWVDYKSINIIEFDLLNKNMSVTNRSFLRRLVFKYVNPQPVKYYFQDIGGIGMIDTEPGALTLMQGRHFVNMNLKNGESVELIRFADKTSSVLFSEFITAVID